jgi:hypothetical protein
MADTIYIDRSKDVREAWVNYDTSTGIRTIITKPKGLVYNDTWQFVIRVVDENGLAADENGNTVASGVKVALKNPTTATLAFSSSMYASASWGWTGSMVISSSALSNSLGTSGDIDAYLQIQIGNVTRLQQKGVPIYFDAIL